MASPELIASWARSEALLQKARASLPENVSTAFPAETAAFAEFLSRNELGLALDTLLEIVEAANCATTRVLQLLRAAAKNMGLLDQEEELARQLAQFEG